MSWRNKPFTVSNIKPFIIAHNLTFKPVFYCINIYPHWIYYSFEYSFFDYTSVPESHSLKCPFLCKFLLFLQNLLYSFWIFSLLPQGSLIGSNLLIAFHDNMVLVLTCFLLRNQELAFLFFNVKGQISKYFRLSIPYSLCATT